MNQTSKELLKLLQEVRKHSKKDALSIMRGLTPDGQHSLLVELRRAALEFAGQTQLPLGVRSVPAEPLPVSSRAKKVPYTVLLPPSMLDALKHLSETDGDPVSHHIRTAIKAYLSRKR